MHPAQVLTGEREGGPRVYTALVYITLVLFETTQISRMGNIATKKSALEALCGRVCEIENLGQPPLCEGMNTEGAKARGPK